jgi:hypothetical protein
LAALDQKTMSEYVEEVLQGAKGRQLLEVTMPDSIDLSYYELVEEDKPYREWCIPAEIINRNATLRLVPFDEEPSRF